MNASVALRRAPVYARRLGSRAFSRAVVLGYHRIGRPDPGPEGLAVEPRNFAAHLDVIAAEGCAVMPLAEIARRAGAGAGFPRRTVGISLDDGYEDSLTRAAPTLSESSFPATVFLASGWLDGVSFSWWDEVERCLRQDGAAPELELAGRLWPLSGPEERQAAYRKLMNVLAAVPPDRRERYRRALREWSGLDGRADPERRPLTADQAAELASLEHIEIGSHTRNHPSLYRRPLAAAEAEVRGGDEDLAEIIGERPRLFAYPFGARGIDYSPAIARVVAACGHTAAFATDSAPVSRISGTHALPRVLIGNLDADGFARRLRRAFLL